MTQKFGVKLIHCGNFFGNREEIVLLIQVEKLHKSASFYDVLNYTGIAKLSDISKIFDTLITNFA